MKKIIRTSGKLLLKALTLIILSIFTVFNVIFKLFAFVFHFLAVPAAVVGILCVVVSYFSSGYSNYLIFYIAASITIVALYYILPLLPPVMDHAEGKMKAYVLSPLVIRSPVKFTL